jgi:hypothetical protein
MDDNNKSNTSFGGRKGIEESQQAATKLYIQKELVEDVQISASLARETEEISEQYFWSPALIATIFSASISCMASIWAFSLAAGIITFIAQDIGNLVFKSSYHLFPNLCLR